MIQFRKIDLSADYPTLEKWWRGHRVPVVDKVLLPPDGWMAHAGGVELAASFLYVLKGKIAIIEFTTTNPSVAFGRDKVAAVGGLYERLEIAARAEGCGAVISFVNPNSWERRTMEKMGYATGADEQPHILFGKPLIPQEAVNSCP